MKSTENQIAVNDEVIVENANQNNRFCDLSEIINRESCEREHEKHGYCGDDYETCICCGKKMKFVEGERSIGKDIPKLRGGRWIRMMTSGHLTDYDGVLPSRLDQGYFAIGNECYKKFLKCAENTNVAKFLKDK